jgi:predicted DNA-binding WGR domain protein
MNQRSLRYTDGKSDKFWEIQLTGVSHTVRYGRYGTAGQTQTKAFDGDDAALKSFEKLVAEKLKKGYVDDGAAIVPPEPVAIEPKKPTTEIAPVVIPENWRSMALMEIQAELVQDKKQLCELAAIDAIPEEYWGLLNVEVRIAIAKQLFNHPNIYQKLSSDHHEDVRIAIASNPHTPSETLDYLVNDKSYKVRLSIAKNQITSRESLTILGNDTYPNICEFSQKTIKSMEEKRQLLSCANIYLQSSIRYSEENISSGLIPRNKEFFCLDKYLEKHCVSTHLPETLREIYTECENDMKVAIAHHQNTPVDVLADLATDMTFWYDTGPDGGCGHLKRAYIREGVARNINTPSQILGDLESEKDLFISLALVCNRNIQGDLLSKIALSSEFKCETYGPYAHEHKKNYSKYIDFIYSSIAHHPNTSQEVLAKIASKKIGNHHLIRTHITVIYHRGNLIVDYMSSDEIARYFTMKHKVEDSSYRSLVILSCIKKSKTLSRLLGLNAIDNLRIVSSILDNCEDWLDRYAIAQNPSTPKALLETLAQDEHPYVQAAARSALGLDIITSSAIDPASEPITIETPQTIAPPPLELKIERSIDLDPKDKLWTTWQCMDRKSSPNAKSFDLQDALTQFKKIEGKAPDRRRKSSGHFPLDWNRAKISSNISTEEAHFWLAAMMYDLPGLHRGNAYFTADSIANSAEALSQLDFQALPTLKDVVLVFLKNIRGVNPFVIIPIHCLFSSLDFILEIHSFHQLTDQNAIAYVERIFDEKYLDEYVNARSSWDRAQIINALAVTLKQDCRWMLERLIEGFKNHICPYLDQIQVETMQNQLKSVLSFQPRTIYLYKIAAYLGLYEDVQLFINSWQVQNPNGYHISTSTGYLTAPEAAEIILVDRGLNAPTL